MRIKAERIEGKYLKRGDIFSDLAPEFLAATNKATLQVFICMHPLPDEDQTFFKLTIVEDPVTVSDPVPSEHDTAKPAYDSSTLWGALMIPHRVIK